MQSFQLDPYAMVVRSTGDSPGVVVGIAALDADGQSVITGPGSFIVNQGVGHPELLVPVADAIGGVQDAITHPALQMLCASAAAHIAHRMIEAQDYDGLTLAAGAWAEFAQINSAQMMVRYSPAESASAAQAFTGLFNLHRTRVEVGGGCGCMMCAAEHECQPANVPHVDTSELDSLFDRPLPTARRRGFRR